MSKHVIKKSSTISLQAALLTNLNVMIGVGIFVNTAPLIKQAGPLSPLSYLIVGCIMLPLILAINKLMIRHKGGNFYTFGAENLSPIWGFISSWSYFIGKLASCSLMIHFFSSLIQNIFPQLNIIPTLGLDFLAILILTFLNCLNTTIGTRIQLIIFLLKISPIIFIILAGIWLADLSNWSYQAGPINNLLPTIPLVVYAFTGFEATCSLASCLKNPEKNGPKAILGAFGIVVLVTIFYQFWSFMIAGNSLAHAQSFSDAFAILARNISSNSATQTKLAYFLQTAASVSAFGAAYGVFYSNNRNVYSLAQQGHLIFSRYFMHLNSHQIPWLAVWVQAFFCTLYLLVTRGNNLPLQQLGAIGCTLAYLISCLGLIKHGFKRNFIGILGLLSSLFLLGLSLLSAFKSTSFAIPLYFGLLFFGVIMFCKTK